MRGGHRRPLGYRSGNCACPGRGRMRPLADWSTAMSVDNRVAVVTGATQGLGLALVEGLAQQMNATDTVYLTGRNYDRIHQAIDALGSTPAEVRGAVLDVAQPDAAAQFAGQLHQEHSAVDIVINNAVMRVGPDDDPGAVVDDYSQVN